MKKFAFVVLGCIGAFAASPVAVESAEGGKMMDVLKNFNKDEMREKVNEAEVKALVFSQLKDMNPKLLKHLLASLALSFHITVDEARDIFTQGIQTKEAKNLLKSLNGDFFGTIETLTHDPVVAGLLDTVAKNTNGTGIVEEEKN